MISRRWIVMGIVGIFLAGWLVFAFAARRDPVIGSYLCMGILEEDCYVFRSDGSFLRLNFGRQLAAGRWEYRQEAELPVQGFQELSVPAREYTLLTETFEPGQHIPDRVFLMEFGYLSIDGTHYYPRLSWLQRLKVQFLNWFQ